MKQLINELNECLGRWAFAERGRTNHSINVCPQIDYDIFSQVTIERVITFCSNHHLHFYVDLEEKKINVYKPQSDIPSID